MIKELLEFIDASPVNFLAVRNITAILEHAGYKMLDASQDFPPLKSGDKVMVTKNGSAVFAFELGAKPLAESGAHIISAHCDSPTFRIKPNAEMLCEGDFMKLDTEVYGGAILSTWMDRPLSLAGRVVLRSDDAMRPEQRLLHIKRPLLQIPNLAIHFNRQVNDGVKLSKQKDMLPVIAVVNDALEADNMLCKIIAEELGVDMSSIIDFDLYLYDTTPACTFGLHDEFVSAGRLDDLSMVHAGLKALQNSQSGGDKTKILAIFDNEETGSQTKQGAGSAFFATLLRRIIYAQGGNEAGFGRMVENSFMISADNAHAWHPNYGEKMDPNNHPMLGGGPVIKYNAAQKYCSDAYSAAVFAGVCEAAGVPYQRFVNHSDVAGGSTLGNILSSSFPVKAVDMGNPVWAMHSVRETGGVADHLYCIKAFTKFYELK